MESQRRRLRRPVTELLDLLGKPGAHHAGRQARVSPDTAFPGGPPAAPRSAPCREEVLPQGPVALNTQPGICHQDKNWGPAWENCPGTQGSSIGPINGKNI